MNKIIKEFPAEIQKWIIKNEWTSLYPIQKKAFKTIPLDPNEILNDFIISSETSTGKTEAAYLPILSRLITSGELKESNGFNILYLSPLVALINDQYERLEELSKTLNISLVKWHSGKGSNKKDAKKATNGILLTTPESLEGFLVRSNRDSAEINMLKGLHAIIIDEIHAFFEAPRGRHLQSVLHRLENHIGKKIPRIALSATLGTATKSAYSVVRPKYEIEPIALYLEEEEKLNIKKTIVELKVFFDSDSRKENVIPSGFDQMVNEIYKDFKDLSRGLIFSNSRSGVELVHEKINQLDGKVKKENEITRFARHHSSVPEKEKKNVEKLMKEEDVGGYEYKPTMTTICTNTLELGIDIGTMEKVGQIESTFSVAALRQRFGRSGRHIEANVQGTLYAIENEIKEEEHILDALKLKTFQAAATINLALEGEFESPSQHNLHLSTLIHQFLSLLYQKNTISTKESYELLVASGPWDNEIIDLPFYHRFLESLSQGKYPKIYRVEESGENSIWSLPPISTDEKRKSHASGVFSTPAQYSVLYGNQSIGQLPMTVQYRSGDSFILNRGKWKVITVSEENRRLYVTRVSNANAPRFGGSAQAPSALIVEEMFKLYKGEKEYNGKSNDEAMKCFKHGQKVFTDYDLKTKRLLKYGKDVIIFPWCGARRSQTLLLLLRREGLSASNHSFSILIENSTIKEVRNVLKFILRNINAKDLDLEELARESLQLKIEKYDRYMTPYHQRLSYSLNFLSKRDINGLIKSILPA